MRISFFVVMLFCSINGFAFESCLLRLEFVDANGRPDLGLEIELRDSGGKSLTRFIATKGSANICDYPFGLHSLKLAHPGCFELLVYGIGKDYPREEIRRIITPDCSVSQASGAGGNACSLLLRITKSNQDLPFPAAKVYFDGIEQGESDSYGRFDALVAENKISEISVSAKGFITEKFRVKCDVEFNRQRKLQYSISLFEAIN